jgi:hypothetical protein
MQSGLGHHAVWYTVINVFEEHAGSVFTGSQKTEAGYCDQNLGIHQSGYMVP